jgi:hypothetical protein
MANSKRLGPSPVIKLFDTDGTVLASGTVETYITETSTPKNSYTSAAGAGSATSFTLDAYGEAVRYFDTDAAYKLIIKDSSGSTVRTVDPYTPVPAPFQLDNDLDMNGFSIISTSNADISITPDGTGDIVLDGLKWPQADGTAGQVLKTDGSAQLGWVTLSTNLVDDTSPQLGADLDTNSYNIQFDDAHGIQDDSGNEQLYFTKTASAVNYINMANAATGNAPVISVAGSDSNIDFNINAKGTGNVVISGLSYPTSDGTADQVISTDGSANLSFTSVSDILDTAGQASMEAATATDEYVVPGLTYHHPGVPKVVGVFQIDGTVDWDYNISSVTDNGTGSWTVNFDITMSSTNYTVVATRIDTGTSDIATEVTSRGTTSCTIKCYDGGVAADPSYGISIAVYGDI